MGLIKEEGVNREGDLKTVFTVIISYTMFNLRFILNVILFQAYQDTYPTKKYRIFLMMQSEVILHVATVLQDCFLYLSFVEVQC